MAALVFVLAMQWPFFAPQSPTLSWAAKTVKGDTLIVVSFPLGHIERACSVMYWADSDLEADRHCWTPRAAIETDTWAGWTMAGKYLVVECWRTAADGYEVIYAGPLPDEGKR